jgi:hypothetical protein
MVCLGEATTLGSIQKILSNQSAFIKRIQDYQVGQCANVLHQLQLLLDTPRVSAKTGAPVHLTMEMARQSSNAAAVMLTWLHALIACAKLEMTA